MIKQDDSDNVFLNITRNIVDFSTELLLNFTVSKNVANFLAQNLSKTEPSCGCACSSEPCHVIC